MTDEIKGESQITQFPLLFGYHDLVKGVDYLAGVRAHGRALVFREDDGWWVYGVNPGGIAAGNRSKTVAIEDFRTRYRSVLYDIAAEAQSFQDFKSEVQRFLNETCEETKREWEEATHEMARVDQSELDLQTRKASEYQPSINVVLVESQEPKDVNQLDEPPMAACA